MWNNGILDLDRVFPPRRFQPDNGYLITTSTVSGIGSEYDVSSSALHVAAASRISDLLPRAPHNNNMC